MKDVLKYVSIEPGGQFVLIVRHTIIITPIGSKLMLWWFVVNLVIKN